ATPGKIMMNLWNGTGVDEWLGSYNGVTPLYAHYDWVRYTKK
ncbi:beta-glucanase, partial [Bacillus inaquosorum]|nr:beta-glucanase [Bacillus inaquosorum]